MVIGGLAGPITVNGVQYNSQMPSLELSDEDIANALTYIYSAWGNSGQVVTPEEVAGQRSSVKATP